MNRVRPDARRGVRRLPIARGPGVEPLAAGRWRVTESGTFALGPAADLSGRWAEVRLAPATATRLPPSSLVVDADGEEQVLAVFPANGHAAARLARFPARAGLLRLHVGCGDFDLDSVDIRPLGSASAALRLALPVIRKRIAQPRLITVAAGKLLRALARGGVPAVIDHLFQKSRKEAPGYVPYPEWRRTFAKLTDEDRRSIRERSREPGPLVSVLLPVYDPPEPWLSRAISSVRAQLYPRWELCIADDASRAPHVRRILEQAAAEDPRIKVVFREQNGHVSAASNSALALATGELVALLDHDDELAEEALFAVASAAGEADLVYSDEDKIDEENRLFDPFFKPDWNPDLLLSQNYVGHLCAIRRALLLEIGGFREGYEGSQDYDVVLRASARTRRIRHLPFALYHWRSIAGSTARAASEKSYAGEAGLRALQDHLGGRARAEPGPFPTTYRVRWPVPEPPPLVTLVIPTRDGRALLKSCIESILQHTAYRRYELLVVDNQSRAPDALAYFRELEERGTARVVQFDAPFNFAALNNFAARHASGAVLGFLNNDIEALESGWLEEMTSHALRPEIGAVGARLLYPDGTIQHGGIVLGVGGVAGHAHKYLPADFPGYFSRGHLVHDVSAVTAACMLVRKQTFEAVGGFDESFAVAFNDVDFCLRVRQTGLRNLWTPFATLIHHESKSRGAEDTPEKRRRFDDERQRMIARWGDALLDDPAYNPNLTFESEDFALAWPPRARKPWEPTA